MTLSNAERQRRYRQRLKARAAILPGAGLYDATVEHLRGCVDADGKIRRRYRPLKLERLSPEELAAELCLFFQKRVQLIRNMFESAARLDDQDKPASETALHVYACLDKIEATVAPPDD